MAPKKIIVEPPISNHEEVYLEVPIAPKKKAKKEPPPKYEEVYVQMLSAYKELGPAFLKAKELTEVLYRLNSTSEQLRVSVMSLREIDKSLSEVIDRIASYEQGDTGLKRRQTWDEIHGRKPPNFINS